LKVSIDSRTLESGDYFIPIKGPNFDGKNYIQEALAKGGRLLDVDLHSYAKAYRKKLSCTVIGITGSSGKTTVKDLLDSVLSQAYKVEKTAENQNNEIGVPLTLLKADFDTEILLVEMAMRHKGDLAHLSKLVRPNQVIVTNVGPAHLQHFSTQKEIAKAKAEIFQSRLPWEAPERKAYLNFSSLFPEFLQKKAESKGFRVFAFEGHDKPTENLNLVTLIGKEFGLSDSQIQEGLEAYESSAHRLKVIKKGSLTVIDDTYNANPDGVRYALQYLKRFDGRKILVLADMLELGEAAQSLHQAVVDDALDAGVAILFTVGSEGGKMQSDQVDLQQFRDKAALKQALVAEKKAGDVILVKGSRAMKMETIVSDLLSPQE